MMVRLTLNPGKPGTKKLLAQYGDKLVCVRYRYDEKRKRRLKTIETIVEELPWKPSRTNKKVVAVKTTATEKTLHQKIRNAGGRWDKLNKTWKLPHNAATQLGLEKRIVNK